jgi:hypothetical protein
MSEKLISFDEQGTPKPMVGVPYTKATMKGLLASSFAEPYEPMCDPITDEWMRGEERFIGMTKGEVLHIRMMDRAAHGDMEAIKFVTEHMVGKPKQQVESVTTVLSYPEMLDLLAQNAPPMVSITMDNEDDEEDFWPEGIEV